MPNDEELRKRHEAMFERMARAGWLENFTYTDGKGWHLGWTAPGAQRSVLLRKIAAAFGLYDDDRAAMAFDVLCQGKSHADVRMTPEQLNADVVTVWSQCVEDLGLRGDADGLQLMIHVVRGWGVDENTPLKFVE